MPRCVCVAVYKSESNQSVRLPRHYYGHNNQITLDRNGRTYASDGDGNPTTYKGVTLTFDPENRMTAYGVPQTGLPLLTAGYTGDGMRAWKESSNGSYTYYIYDGTDTIAELSGTGTLNVYYTVGGNGLVSKRTGSTSSFFTYDPVGSVSTVTNSTGAVQGDEAFDATGMRVNGYTSRPVDFCGQWGYHFDDETGLLLCSFRYYDPYTARFLTRDPVGHAGGINLYSYGRNNPCTFIDPTGFSPDTINVGNPTETDIASHYASFGLARPADKNWDCPDDVYYELRDVKFRACKVNRGDEVKCSLYDCMEDLWETFNTIAACVNARLALDIECFNGGNPNHQSKTRELILRECECLALIARKSGRPSSQSLR